MTLSILMGALVGLLVILLFGIGMQQGGRMKYEDIKDFSQRWEEHPEYQSGMNSHQMFFDILCEEIDELREYIEKHLRDKK